MFSIAEQTDNVESFDWSDIALFKPVKNYEQIHMRLVKLANKAEKARNLIVYQDSCPYQRIQVCQGRMRITDCFDQRKKKEKELDFFYEERSRNRAKSKSVDLSLWVTKAHSDEHPTLERKLMRCSPFRNITIREPNIRRRAI